jgi:arylsulfatase A-like enzyme
MRTGTATSSPITVTALTNATAYSCSVIATNGIGNSAASGAVAVTPQVTVATQPNILLIIADDMGLDASNQYSYSNDRPSTPTLDGLASAGIVFDNVWATPACATTRGTLITGQHGVHSGITYVPAVMSTSAITLQKYLKAQSASAHYQTAVIGKWHLGGANAANSHPTDSGVGYYAGNLFAQVDDYYNWTLVENDVAAVNTTYNTTKLTDLALSWVSAQTQPWFLWLAYNAPHAPFHVPPTSLQRRVSNGTTCTGVNRRTCYLAAIEAIDSEIGRLLSTMNAATKANTVIIFVGDNGTPATVVDDSVFIGSHAKDTLYEGGIRVPMIVSGKGVTRSGEHEAALINTVDFYASIAQLAGNSETQVNDGYSFVSLLETGGIAARQYNYSEFVDTANNLNGWVVRNAQYKLFQSTASTSQELYNLNEPQGIAELTNRISDTALTTTVDTLRAQGETIRTP